MVDLAYVIAGENPARAHKVTKWMKLLTGSLWGISSTYPSTATSEDIAAAELQASALYFVENAVVGLVGGFGSEAAPVAEGVNVGHTLLVDVIDESGAVVRSLTIRSGRYGVFGHTEVKAVRELWRTLKPGWTVLMQGQYPICRYGLCSAVLGAAARITGADIYYFNPTWLGGYSTRTYFGGVGLVLKTHRF
jgi:hypothetical protein